jgi:hypothetical protein
MFRFLVVVDFVVGVKCVPELITLKVLRPGVCTVRRGDGDPCKDGPDSEASAQ